VSVETAANPEQSAQIWQEAKGLLARLSYHRKCGYCEFDMLGGAFGPADHFRPKSSLSPVCTPAHHGYWWVAYDWRNLIPACDICNNRKSDEFPITGRRGHGPSDGGDSLALDATEQRLLLHPMLDTPESHLSYNEFGLVAPRHASPQGAATIRVCALDREELEESRRARIEEAILVMRVLSLLPDPQGLMEAFFALVTRSDQRYATAVRESLIGLINSGRLLGL
jgi:uncharacterized protein (TIGR02646 family)